MASREETYQRLALLYRIHGVTAPSAGLERLLQEERFPEAEEEINKTLIRVEELIAADSSSSSSSLWHPLESTLSEEEYVLPPELEEVHPKVIRDITSGKPISRLPSGGLLLYGPAVGTGKSEYFSFLASQIGERAHFVVANLDRIAGNPNPGTTLRTLYHDLDSKAKKEGVMYVVLLDEFERIVTKHATQHTAVKDVSSDTSTGRGANIQHRRETRETLELDDVGAQTFATLKTLISGGDSIQYVYTVATSNQSAYEDALLRRLTPVELKAFGMPTFNIGDFSREPAPDYKGYATRLPRMIKILQAAYMRDNKKRSSHLEKILKELQNLFDDLRDQYVVEKAKDVLDTRQIKKVIAQKAMRNNGYLEALLRYFGCDLKKVTEDKEKIRIAIFAGYFYSRGIETEPSRRFSGFDGKTTKEHQLVDKLVPDTIGKWYKDNTEAFATYKTAKEIIGRSVFPQLVDLIA